MTILSEPGLSHAIINRKPQKAKGDDGEAAKKIEMAIAFRKWVTDVVLVSIRKHGGYIQGQELLDGPEKAELIAEMEFKITIFNGHEVTYD